jgi:hypothetical protein
MSQRLLDDGHQADLYVQPTLPPATLHRSPTQDLQLLIKKRMHLKNSYKIWIARSLGKGNLSNIKADFFSLLVMQPTMPHSSTYRSKATAHT